MTSVPEDLPPKWRQNMQERRACLFHFEPDNPISARRARSIALELIVRTAEGEWACEVVQLDDDGRDWEFRYRPRRPRPRKARG